MFKAGGEWGVVGGRSVNYLSTGLTKIPAEPCSGNNQSVVQPPHDPPVSRLSVGGGIGPPLQWWGALVTTT